MCAWNHLLYQSSKFECNVSSLGNKNAQTISLPVSTALCYFHTFVSSAWANNSSDYRFHKHRVRHYWYWSIHLCRRVGRTSRYRYFNSIHNDFSPRPFRSFAFQFVFLTFFFLKFIKSLNSVSHLHHVKGMNTSTNKGLLYISFLIFFFFLFCFVLYCFALLFFVCFFFSVVLTI